MILDADIRIYFIQMHQNEAVSENDDGTYTVFIDESLSQEGRIEAYNHAKWHIEHNDFEKQDVQKVEINASTRVTSLPELISVDNADQKQPVPDDQLPDWYWERYEHAKKRHKAAHRRLLKYEDLIEQFHPDINYDRFQHEALWPALKGPDRSRSGPRISSHANIEVKCGTINQ